MQYATLAQAMSWVEEGAASCDPKVTKGFVNTIRQEWYNWYQEVSLFLDAVECYRVQRYFYDCKDCTNFYFGVTLGREAQTVEAMWWNQYPIRLNSQWREWQTGITPECDCRLQKFDMPAVCTFRDIPTAQAWNLQFVAVNPEDTGRKVIIRGIDDTWKEVEETITLGQEPSKISRPLISVHGRGGIIKEETLGRVLLMNCHNGALIGDYQPDETVPTYSRLKITGLAADCDCVNVRSARRYFDLHNPTDVVETANKPAFDAMARYLRLYKMTERDRAAAAAMVDHLAKARNLLIGEKSRQEGKATNAELKLVTPNLGHHSLSRTTRGRW